MIGIAFYNLSGQQPVTCQPVVSKFPAPASEDFHERFRRYLMEVFQMAGIYTPEEAFFLFVKPLQRIAEKQVEAELENPDSTLSGLYVEMERVEQAQGLREGAFWRLAEAPREYQTLNQQWQDEVARITNRVLTEYGENDIADLYRQRPDEFRRRMQVGGERLSGRHAAWLQKLNDWLP
jgi:hypothetical protein